MKSHQPKIGPQKPDISPLRPEPQSRSLKPEIRPLKSDQALSEPLIFYGMEIQSSVLQDIDPKLPCSHVI